MQGGVLFALFLEGGDDIYCKCSMGRVDILARMIIVLMSQQRYDIVCGCFKGLHCRGHHEVLEQSTLAIAQMGRPDVIALVLQCCLPKRVTYK